MSFLLALMLSSTASAEGWQDTNVAEWADSDWQAAAAEWPGQVDVSMAELQELEVEVEALLLELDAVLLMEALPEAEWVARARDLLERMEAHEDARFGWGYGTQVIGDDKALEHIDADAHARVREAQATQEALEALYYGLDVRLAHGWLRYLVAAQDTEASTLGERVGAAGDLLGAIGGGFDYEPGYYWDDQAVLLGIQHVNGNAAWVSAAELCLEQCTDAQAIAASEELIAIGNDPLQNGGVEVYMGDENLSMAGINDDPDKGPLVSFSGVTGVRRLMEPSANQFTVAGDVRIGRKRLGGWVGGAYARGLQGGSSGFAVQGGATLDVLRKPKLMVWVNPGLSYDGFGNVDSPEYFQERDLGVIAPLYVALPVGRVSLMWVTQPRWTFGEERINSELSLFNELQMGPRVDLHVLGDLSLSFQGQRYWVPGDTVNVLSVGLASKG